MSYITPDKVNAITGEDVSEADIARASVMIEIRTGIIEEQVPTLYGRDAYWIRTAIAYQAAWLSGQPDLNQRMDVSSISQDGVSVTPMKTGLTLAPLARETLKRLSWRGTRSSTHEQRVAGVTDARFDDDLDVLGRPLDWRPLS